MQITRFESNPIIRPHMDARMGDNINGPSLIRAPDWLPDRRGRYCLYFAHHQGRYIRLACADRLEDPWRTYEPGVLDLSQAACSAHVASPDVHVDHETRQLRMYLHGSTPDGQKTYVATSTDGVHFTPRPEVLGPFYFRVFHYRDCCYAIANVAGETQVLRSRDGLTPFEPGPLVLPRARHTAVLRRGDVLWIFFSRIGDTPEHILLTSIDLSGDWTAWKEGEVRSALEPEMDYEGVGLPIRTSLRGWAPKPVRELRDPCVYEEDGGLYLLYSVAGEQGIAIAEITDLP
jgi:hypothetical protein